MENAGTHSGGRTRMKRVGELCPGCGCLARSGSALSVLVELFKVRLTCLVLLTTAAGFYLATPGPGQIGLMWSALAGTALLTWGAAALNEFFERENDAKMVRTRSRPLPEGHLTPECVLWIGSSCALAGTLWLGLGVCWLAAGVGVIALVIYLCVYTPLKRISTLSSLIGAVSGALPPVVGWAAAQGRLTGESWSLFAILFVWQLPHSLMVNWIHREEYAKGGFATLPPGDSGAKWLARTALLQALCLLPISFTPFLLRVAGVVYLWLAVALGVGFVVCAVRFLLTRSSRRARVLFYASILYLPLLLSGLILGRA